MIVQRGRGFNKFEGSRYQRGHGWGSFLGRIYKFIKPHLKSTFDYVSKHAVDTGINVGKDFLAGEEVNKSFKKRVKEKGQEMIGNLEKKMKTQVGMGRRRRKSKTTTTKRRSNKRSRKSKKLRTTKKRSSRKKSYNKLKRNYIKELVSAYK